MNTFLCKFKTYLHIHPHWIAIYTKLSKKNKNKYGFQPIFEIMKKLINITDTDGSNIYDQNLIY